MLVRTDIGGGVKDFLHHIAAAVFVGPVEAKPASTSVMTVPHSARADGGRVSQA